MPESKHELLCITAPGLEEATQRELHALGLSGTSLMRGGVALHGTTRHVQLANLHLRTASRVVIRVERFHASSFHELERRAKRVPWGRYLRRADRARFRVTCHKSALYHSDGVAQRLAESATAVTGAAVADADDETAQLFVVRLENDRLTLSVDSSGALLHRRGYRLATAKAPLRETLAAAMLLESGWAPGSPLLDPLCGAGTIAIEAALIARGVAPGIRRKFAFERWPGFDAKGWAELLAAAESAQRVDATPIFASDRDEGAIAACVANAERAGVASAIDASVASLSAAQPSGEPGWVVTNPPYGVRVGEDVRNLYATLGKLMRGPLDGWRLAMLAPGELFPAIGLPFQRVLETENGGIPVALMRSVGEA